MLNYNSRVWGRHENAVTFDPIASWPTPGFSLGFGRIVPYELNYGVGKFLLIEPDGTRRYLGASNPWCSPCQTSDGSHLNYSGDTNGGSLLRPDGTVTYFGNVNNRLLPTQILDRNGNFILIAYRPLDEYGMSIYPPAAIDYVTDTLGRHIQFNYDTSGRLINITAPGFGGTTQNPVTQTIAQFDYQTRTLAYSFSGLAVENVGYGAFDALRHVYFPATGTGYLFTYSAYGMIYNYSVRRQMGISSADGVESANVTFNYPTTGSTVLTDAPAFTQRTETAVSCPTSVYTYSTSTDTIAQTMTFTITRPDSTMLQLTRSTNASSPANGRVLQTELKSGAASLAKTVLTYVNDGGGSPQVQSVTGYDDTSTPVKTDFDYDANGNVINKREYGYQTGGGWQVRRRTHFAYTSIANAVNLVTEVDAYDAQLNTNDADDVLIAKSTYAYDNYVAMGGMENYGGTANPPSHYSSYNETVTGRGNVTGVTQWTDTAAGTTIQHLAKLDIFGSVVKAQVSCCQEKDLTNTQATYWSQPESEMSGDPNGMHQTTSADYDFNTSLPRSAIDAGGLTTTYGYDAALNPSSVSLPTGASANTGHDYGNLSSSSSVSYTDGTNEWGDPVTKTITTSQAYDGWGRVIQSVDRNNGQVNTSYDAMGRVTSRTNPFTAGGTPGPATTFQYDITNKAVITLPGGNTVRSDYSGSTVTVTDQVNRKIQRISDGLGRLVTVNEQDATGSLTQATTYSYDYLDKLTQVNQGGQLRSYKYDAMGRLLYERIPEQSATINDGTGTYWSCKYTYTEFSAMATKQDARGVVTTYSYDSLHRVGGISYNTSGAPGVAATDPVSFGYTAWGSLSSVCLTNVALGYSCDYSESYTFDSLNRPASVTHAIAGQSTTGPYTTSYQYNGAGQTTQMTYPSSNVVNMSYDSRGRLNFETNALSSVSYNTAGQITTMTLPNLATQTLDYDANRMQLTSQVATKSGGPTGGLMNLAYNYQSTAGQMGVGSTAGNAGQLMSISGTIGGTTESAAYTYDNLGRLVTSNQTSNGATAQRSFSYDRWGNRIAMSDATSGGSQIQSITLQQSGGAPTNRIQGVDSSSSGVSLNSGGYLDGAVCNAISGWGWDANQPNAAINVDVYDGNTLILTVAANQFRQDLLNAGLGNGYHGFSFATPASLKNGVAHNVHTKVAGTSIELGYSPRSITCSTVNSASGGYLDGADCNAISGWAWDGNQPNTAINVDIYDGNTLILTVAANQFRQDLLNAGLGNGYHGFSFATPASLKNGLAHNVHTKVAGTSIELGYSPSSVTCGSYTNYVSYTYDAAGNVTNDGVHSYTYDAENRLVSVDGGATAQYRYDHQNRRVAKIVGSSWTHYVWEGSHVIAEHDGTTSANNYYGSTPYQQRSSKLDYIYAGSKLISTLSYTHSCYYDGPSIISSTTLSAQSYYLSDRLSTRLVLDYQGNITGHMAHLPFGEDFAESGSQEKHHFTSYERDVENGTDYAINRQYSQSLGRFMRPDPLASSAKKETPQLWNRYSYANNEPIDNHDPSGLGMCPSSNPANPFENCSQPPGIIDPAELDPCSPHGASYLSDGFETANTDFTCLRGPVPSPNPAPEVPDVQCEVSVRFKPLSGVAGLFGAWHAYIVTTELQGGVSSSVPQFYRAGPRGRFLPRINAIHGPYVEGTVDFSGEARPNIRFTFSGGCFLFDVAFTSVAQDVNRRNLVYEVIRHNSNSFAYTALKAIGILITEQQIYNQFPIWHLWLPGWGQDLLH